MARALIALACSFGLSVASLIDTDCQHISVDEDSAGTCKLFSCNANRGHTYCKWGKCWCSPGFCEMAGSAKGSGAEGTDIDYWCAARIEGHTCNVFNCRAYNSFCDHGRCFCKYGYKQEGTSNNCVKDPSFGVLLELIAQNATQEEIGGGAQTKGSMNATQEEIAEFLDFHMSSDRKAAQSNFIFVIGLCASVGVAVGAVGVYVTRRGRGKVALEEQLVA